MTWEDEDDAPRRHSHSHSSVDRIPFFPVLLIAFGTAALLHQIVGRGVSVIPLAIGIYLIARSRASAGGHYPLLVIGAVLTGSGAGNLLGDILNTGISDALGTLGTAAGFFWLFTTDRQRSSWAIVPAAIVGLIGVGRLGFQLTDVMRGGSGGWLLPAGVVVAGVLLLGAHRLPGPLRLAGLVFVGAAALSLVTNSNDTHPRERGARVIPTVPAESSALPDLTGKTLVVKANNGSVTINAGEPKVVSGRVSSTDGDEVTVEPLTSNSSVVVSAPAGTHLDITTNNGSIIVLVPSADIDAQSNNGSIQLQLQDDPEVDAESENNHVVVDGSDEGRAYAHNGDVGSVDVHSNNGQILLTRVKQPAGAGQR